MPENQAQGPLNLGRGWGRGLKFLKLKQTRSSINFYLELDPGELLLKL